MAVRLPHGYRSASEYCFNEEQADAIVRVAAYHRRDFDLAVIWFPPREHDAVHRSIATPFARISNSGLGSLGRLPIELLHDVLFRLDLQSLFVFRQTNLRSRQTVDSLKQYQMIIMHGLNLFCALLRTRLAIDISLRDFYDAMCTEACSLCDEFGGFMSLLTWKRCCFECMKEASEIRAQPRFVVQKQLSLTLDELDQLKSFNSLPGVYTMKESEYKSRIVIVSVHQACLLTKWPFLLKGARLPISAREQTYNFMASCALPYYGKSTGKVEYGVSCAGCQLAVERDIIGSDGEVWGFKARDKVYARDGFLEHFRWCEQSQLLWTSSREGCSTPIELPEAVRRGGFFNARQ